MKILAIDTSTEACSAALLADKVIYERQVIAPRGHADQILAMLDDLLVEAGLTLSQVDALAFGCGPGAFTGVRIGVSVAQGVAFAADLPVVPVSSLQALAQGVISETEEEHVAVAIDARMGEVYWGAYRCVGELAEPVGEEGLYRPAEVPQLTGRSWFGAGTGWGSYAEELAKRLGKHVHGSEALRYPLARDVVALAVPRVERGECVAAEEALPTYLRDNVAQVKSR